MWSLMEFTILLKKNLAYLNGTNTGNISLSAISDILVSTGVTGTSFGSTSGGGGGGAATVKTIWWIYTSQVSYHSF